MASQLSVVQWSTKAWEHPHFHLEAHIVCAYQYGTLEDIVAKIKTGMMDAAMAKSYRSWQHTEHVIDEEEHADFLPRVNAEWEQRFLHASTNS